MAPTAQIILEFNSKGEVASVKAAKSVGDAIDSTAKSAKEMGEAVGNGAKSAAKDIEQLASKAESISSVLSKVAKQAIAAFGAGFSIKQTVGDFKTYQSALVDMGRVTDENLTSIDKKIRDLPPELGSATQLMQGYYQILSAGVADSAQALDTLTVASKASKAAHVEQGAVVVALTKLMAGYSGEITSAADASDLLFSIDNLGQTSVGELVNYVGDLASMSKQAGVSVSEMGATLAALTQTAGGTSQAATQYRAVLAGLIRPQEKMQQVLAQLGYTSGVAMIKQEGLAKSIMKIDDQARKSGYGIGQLIESVEAIAGIGPLLQTNFSNVFKYIDEIDNRAGTTFKAFGRYAETIDGQLDSMLNSLKNVSIGVGESFGNASVSMLKAVNTGLEGAVHNLDTLKSAALATAAGMAAIYMSRQTQSAILPAIGGQVTDVKNYKQALIDASKAELEEAKAAQTQYNNWLKMADAQRYMAKSASNLNDVKYSGIEITQRVATAEKQLTAATDMSSAAAVRAGVASKSLGTLRAGWNKLLGFFGGGWGLAITAATASIAYLSTRQSEGEEIARRYADVQSTVESALKGAGNAAEDAAGKINNLSLTQTKEKLEQAKKDIEATKKSLFLAASLSLGDQNTGEATGYEPFRKELYEIIKGMAEGRVAFEKEAKEIDRIGSKLDESGRKQAQKLLDDIVAYEKVNISASQAQSSLSLSADGANSSMQALTQAMLDGANAAITWVASTNGVILNLDQLNKSVQSTALAQFISTLGEKQKRIATALGSAGLNRDQVAAALKNDLSNFAPEQAKAIQDIMSNVGKTTFKGASTGTNAREQLQKIREEIAALNGEATKSSNSLEQKEREIEKLGKAAGLSASDIDKLKTQYGDAFKTNALQGFNKQIAQLEGNTKALRDIQLDEEVKKWSASFNELVSKGKMTTGEAAENIERLKTAISKSVETKDTQTSLSFIKEYSQLSGDFSQNQKILLEMLEREAEVYRATLPASLQPYVDKWQELKKLQEARDPLSGSIRGLRSYSNEAMNLAKGIEGAWTSGFTAMEDALVKFTMSGKLSFSDMANSIISDLMRIAIRSSITGPLASGFGSMFSGWGGGSSASFGSSSAFNVGTSTIGMGTAIVKHAGGMVDGFGPTRSVPLSAFDYAPRFHSGGGLFKRDEYPAVLQYGERVLNRQETAAYNARDWAGRDLAGKGGGYSGGSEPTVNVVINNNTSAAITQQTRTDNRGNRAIEITVGDMVAGQAMKPGSTMNRALRTATGAQQQATRR